VRFDDARLAISNLGNLGGRCDPGSAHEEGVDPAALCTTGARTNHTPHELYIENVGVDQSSGALLADQPLSVCQSFSRLLSPLTAEALCGRRGMDGVANG
jgi:hypothetical protein